MLFSRPVRSLRPVAVAALCILALACALHADFPADTATYLAGAQDDTVGGIEIDLGGDVLWAGTLPGFDPDGVVPTVLLGAGDGALVRFASDGRTVRAISRLGDGIGDLALAIDPAQPAATRIAVAVDGIGPVVLDAQGDAVLWQGAMTNVRRVDVGSLEKVPAARRGDDARGGLPGVELLAALSSSKRVETWNIDGTFLAGINLSDDFVEDVAVDPLNNRVIVTGWNNRNTGNEPVQIPFIRAYTALLDSVVWTNYQWEPSVLVNTQNNSVSDSRGYRVTIGPDGQLYYAGFSDGGNTTYRFDPQDPARQLASDELISFDNYNTSFGLSGARSLNHHARYDPATGAIDRIQITLTRLSSGGGNSINVRGIAADPAGRIYMVGQAFATIANRDAQSLAGQPVGPYQGGELHLLIVSPDFQMRDTWTVFTADGGSQGSTGRAIAVRDGAIAFAADIGNSTAQMLTVAPLQAARTATDDVYLVVQKGARIFAGDFEGGTTAGWTAP